VHTLDDEQIRWRRVGNAPLMEAGKAGVPADVPGGWSDPYVFSSQGRTFITFKACGGLVCEANNKELTDWKCIGKLAGVIGECPNVFKLGDKWAIIRSTGRAAHTTSYVTGQLVVDGNDIQFKVDGPAQVLDYGYGGNKPAGRHRVCHGLYGTNTYEDPKGRRIMCGHISGFKNELGWNGCMSLPRILTLDEHGNLIQTPVPELKKLRGEHKRVAEVPIQDELKLIEGAGGRQIEVTAEFSPGDAKAFGVKLRSSDNGEDAITLRYADGVLNVAGTEVPLKLDGGNKTLKLQVFLDRSVMEVFVNDGRAAVTRVEYPGEEDLAIGVFAEGGKATLRSLDVWQMKSIW
jgi:beta-fructofuranosidase